MTNIFIIHGAEGYPEENWYPWLKLELEKFGNRVFVPKFPTPNGQTLDNWMKVFKKYEQWLNHDSIVVGHSLGPVFLLNVLEKLREPIKAAFLVASYCELPNDNMWYKSVKTFLKPFDWRAIKKNCGKFFVFHSDNDPYFKLELGEGLAKNLDAQLIIVKNAGHFNAASGYTKFPLLLEKIKKEL